MLWLKRVGSYIKQHIFKLMLLIGLGVLFEVLGHWVSAGLLGIALVALLLVSYVKSYFGRFIFLVLALFSFIVAIFLTESVWLFFVVLIVFYYAFKGPQGHEFIVWGESLIHPFSHKQDYHGIQLVQPQSAQRTLLKRQSIIDVLEKSSNVYEWNDVNIVYFGGNSIIDCGNTLLPQGQSTVVIRKVFGKTRLIVPRDIGLKLNISMLSGKLSFESQHYRLLGENFMWATSGYQLMPRQLNVIISVAFGEVEVIML